MVKFLDGPAAGVVLALRRAPPWLRVTRRRGAKPREVVWDALDQLADAPAPVEDVYAYRRLGKPAVLHINFTRGKGAKSGWYAVARYALADPPPDEATMRSTEAWRAWATEQAAAAKAAGRA